MIEKAERESLESEFARQLFCEQISVVKQFRFDLSRRFRFDFAIPELRIAIEIQGGIFTAGRHSRGAGQLSDMEKFNLAQRQGWRVFLFGPPHVSDGTGSLFVATFVRELQQLVQK